MSTSIPNSPRLLRSAPSWAARAADLPAATQLASRGVGEVIADHRTSWVRRLATPAGAVFVKTYEYAGWRSRLRNWGKRVAPWSKSRPHREFEALQWLRANGFDGPEPLAVHEWRRFGFLVRATLVTLAADAVDAQRLLPRLTPEERLAAAAAIGAFTARLHAAGFRDGNLDLRNLLLAAAPDGWRVSKIDSPRFRLRTPGTAVDRLVRADWDRLLPQLQTFGLAEVATAAAAVAAPR